MQKQFKVGQVWQCSNGDVERITEISHDTPLPCPIVCASGMIYTLDGKALTDGEQHPCDLVQLIYDPSATAKFDRDQMAWEIYRDWQSSPDYDSKPAAHAYRYVDDFLAEMAKQHEAKQ